MFDKRYTINFTIVYLFSLQDINNSISSEIHDLINNQCLKTTTREVKIYPNYLKGTF